MIDPRAPSIELSINDTEYTIHQSPSLLSSHRAGGTTGAGMYDLHDFLSTDSAPQVLVFESRPESVLHGVLYT
jgi:hypothetical protein